MTDSYYKNEKITMAKLLETMRPVNSILVIFERIILGKMEKKDQEKNVCYKHGVTEN